MPKAKGPLEKVVKTRVRTALQLFGAYFFFPVQAGLGAKTVDCLACVPVVITKEMVGSTVGIFVAIETKRPGVSKVTPHQQFTLEDVRDAGGVALLVNSDDQATVTHTIAAAIELLAGPIVSVSASLGMEGGQ